MGIALPSPGFASTDIAPLHQIRVSEQEADFRWKLLFKNYARVPAYSPSLRSREQQSKVLGTVDRPLYVDKGLSRLLSADSTDHEIPKRRIDGEERLEVIGATRDSKFGGEGGLYCSFFRNPLVFCHFVCKTSIFCRL